MCEYVAVLLLGNIIKENTPLLYILWNLLLYTGAKQEASHSINDRDEK